MNRTIPIINTGRLSLRPMKSEDFDRFAQIWAMPEVVRYIGGVPRTRAQSWEVFLRNEGHWQMTGFGQWAIWQAQTRCFVGQTGFFYGTRTLGPDFDAYPEAGWVLAPEAQGQGLGSEAVRAAHDWFDRIMPGVLVALIDAEHHASLHLAERMGYRTLRVADVNGRPCQLLRRNGPPAGR